MRNLPFLPALAMGSVVSLALLWARLEPYGTANMLVRLQSSRPDAAIVAASAADAALMAIPRPGYVVLRGDAAKIRHTLGYAVGWEGAAGCTAPRL